MSSWGTRRFGRSVHVALAAAGVACALLGSAVRADDLDTVRSRVVADLLSSTPSATTVNGYRSSLASNGSWSDINYGSTASVSWEPLTHLDRLQAMAEAYSDSGNSLYQNSSLKSDILKAYNYWISSDPQSSNWYYNEISTPQELGNSMVLISGILSSSQKSNGLDVLKRAYVDRNDTSLNTGQNKVDRAIAGVSRGIVADSSSITADAFAAIGDTLVITSGDGIQRDQSFHQHGDQLYNSGYGSDFVASTVQTLKWNAGTTYAFSDAKEHLLIDHILDSTQWMIRGEVIDYTASGRDITRKSQDDGAASFSGRVKTILDANLNYRTDELTAFRTRQLDSNDDGGADAAHALTGNRQFWQSDLMTHQRPDFYASVKTSSTRTTQPETGNDEGLKNLYLGDGVNLIMRTGNEYDNIMPVWNWRRLPGTTVEQDSRSLKPTADFGVSGTATFAGGASDGLYGTTGFHYDRYHVDAKKSWFFFDKEFVGLGAAINSPDSVNDVNTTINQSLLKGTVSYETTASSATKTIALGDSITPANLKWVFHDGTGYFFPAPVSNVNFRAVTLTGDWESINERYDNTSVSKDVFMMYVNHGHGFTGGTYNYIVVPGLTVGQMDDYLANNPIDILKNTSSVQAIRQTSLDVTQATFYSATSLSIASGQAFAVSNPSSVIMRRPANTLQFTAASPENKSFELSIDLAGIKFAGSGSSWLDGFSKSATVTLGLPSGDRAGDSVGIAISTDGDASPVIRWTTFDTPTTFAYSSDANLALPGNTTFSAGSNKTLTFSGAISGNASLSKTGASDLILSGLNTYTGGTNVSDGTLTLKGDQRSADGGWSIGPDSENLTTVTFASGSKVTVAAGGTIGLGADTARGTQRQQLSAYGTVTNNGTLFVQRYSNLHVTGVWTQTGDMTVFAKGDDSFSPAVTIDDGGSFTYKGSSAIQVNPSVSATGDASINIGSADGPGTFTINQGFERTVTPGGGGTSNVRLRNGGVLILSADVPQLTIGDFLFRVGDGGGIVDTAGHDASLNTGITNESGTTGGFTKRGAGTLELLKGGTYVGGTSLSGGALKVSNTSGSATGTGAVTLESGTTLTGAGKITGAVTVKAGATIAPGDVAGTLTTGAQTWAGGGHYAVDISGVDNTSVAQTSRKGTTNGADWVNLTGALGVTATSASRFRIDVNGVGNSSGNVTGWDRTRNYTWTVATAAGGITGYADDRFTVDVSGMPQASSSLGGWGLSRTGNDVLLNYSTNTINLAASAPSTPTATPGQASVYDVAVSNTGSLSLAGLSATQLALDVDGSTDLAAFLHTLQLATGSQSASITSLGSVRPGWVTALPGSTDWDLLVQLNGTGDSSQFAWNFQQNGEVLLDRVAVLSLPEPCSLAILAFAPVLLSRQRRRYDPDLKRHGR